MKSLWSPPADSVESSLMARFMREQGFEDYGALHQWSVGDMEAFWAAVWDFCGVVGDKIGPVVREMDQVPYARFFPEAKISFAENLLAYGSEHPEAPAIVARCQDGDDRVLSWRDLAEQVSVWQQALEGLGVVEGDRVAVYLPNIPETVVILLAVSNIGAVFASAGMEMGASDLVGRFAQIEPKVVVTQRGYVHGAKIVDRMDVIERVAEEIGSVGCIVLHDADLLDDVGGVVGDVGGVEVRGKKEEGRIVEEVEGVEVEGIGTGVRVEKLEEGQRKEGLHYVKSNELLANYGPRGLEFVRRDFNHPLYILFSSGSTGAPKCFEHSSGGVLLKHLVEYQLHSDVQAGDVMFYHATPSWMMWNWLASGVASGATILMYDGHPFYPDVGSQWRFTAAYDCTHHGTAAPVILGWEQQGLDLSGVDMPELRVVLSTGAVLPVQGYHFIHEHIKGDVKVASISGGTDLVGCFLGGNPLVPTYAGQVNGVILGCDIQVWNEEGDELRSGEVGELVCANQFPSMPLRFLNDVNGERYFGEYFEHFEGFRVWRHGDSVQRTEEGQFVVIGRSDATLNQNGVRIGPAVIYEQIEKFSDEVRDYAAVDFSRPDNAQAITVLFLVSSNSGGDLSDDLVGRIKAAVKENVTPYAIPTEVIAVSSILKTPNGKKAEVVMKKILAGKDVKNASLYGDDLVRDYVAVGEMLREKYS